MKKKHTKEENQARHILRLKRDITFYQEIIDRDEAKYKKQIVELKAINAEKERPSDLLKDIDFYKKLYENSEKRYEYQEKRAEYWFNEYIGKFNIPGINNPNDSINTLKNSKPAQNREMTEEEINRLIEEKRAKN